MGKKERAERHAIYCPRVATDAHSLVAAALVPEFDGDVVSFDLSQLRFLVIPDWLSWHELAQELTKDVPEGKQGWLTPDSLEYIQDVLVTSGYDGLEIRNNGNEDDEVGVFPGSLDTLREL